MGPVLASKMQAKALSGVSGKVLLREAVGWHVFCP